MIEQLLVETISLTSSFTEFLDMKGKGIYIWPSWGLALLVLLYNVLIPKIKHKQLKKMISNSPDPRQSPVDNDLSETSKPQ